MKQVLAVTLFTWVCVCTATATRKQCTAKGEEHLFLGRLSRLDCDVSECTLTLYICTLYI